MTQSPAPGVGEAVAPHSTEACEKKGGFCERCGYGRCAALGPREEALTVEQARALPPGTALEVVNADTFLQRKGFPNGSRVTLRHFDGKYVDIAELPYPTGTRPFRFAAARPQSSGEPDAPAEVEGLVERLRDGTVWFDCATMVNEAETDARMREAAATLEALSRQVEGLTEALIEIEAGRFNCAGHQRFMAAQGVAERALAAHGAGSRGGE